MEKLILEIDKLNNKKREYLSNFKHRKSILNKERKKKIKEKHHKFVKDNRKVLLWLDIAFVIIILFNLGALLITNALVIKDEPTKEIMEANPVASEIHGFKLHPEAKFLFFTFIFFISTWVVLSFMYVQSRRYISEERHFSFLIGFIIFYGIALGTDK